ncbi:MAG: VCBS repeat-containing protein [Nitrospirae bacterium]|nr:VCBS repeat-containing protein [Nitrospirota bacterium]
MRKNNLKVLTCVLAKDVLTSVVVFLSFAVAGQFLLALPTPVLASPTLEGCTMLPANNIWNTPIDKLPLDPNSSTYVATIGVNNKVHPDFGAGLWEGKPMGIPYNIVTNNQTKVNVTFDYADESDPGPYPIPSNAEIEGGAQSTGDRHILIVDKDNCVLYELYYAFPQNDGSWTAGSGAIFNLKSNALRPNTWTSADAAGLPILPGLVRYDEVASGQINHAIRFTVPQTRNTYLWPARHKASSQTDTKYPPMGQRFRLKASFNSSVYSPEVQVILNALKKYGMIIADNGSSWYISGVPDSRWNNDKLVTELSTVHGSDFEAVDESSLMINADSGQAKSRKANSDFNGDGNSDILWHNASAGQTVVWFVNGSTLSGASFLGGVDSNWQVKGKGDFDGDGNSDILWYNTATGQVAIWLLNSATKVSTVGALGTVGADWQIRYVGDFNGDGKSDILWQNNTTGQVAVWLLNGAAIDSAAFLGLVDSQWLMAGVGDANGDGKDDVFWYNSTTGQVVVWLLKGTSVDGGRYLGYGGPSWQFKGVGDLNGDGTTDIIWQNSASGQVAVWLLNNAVVTGASSVGAAGAPYQFLGIGDFNGDGTTDILWQNSTTGEVVVWLINSASIANAAVLGKVDAQWSIK